MKIFEKYLGLGSGIFLVKITKKILYNHIQNDTSYFKKNLSKKEKGMPDRNTVLKVSFVKEKVTQVSLEYSFNCDEFSIISHLIDVIFVNVIVFLVKIRLHIKSYSIFSSLEIPKNRKTEP
ncbi:hypothetical protein Avbf_17678 [Armadillidium vulgare]|nr:hypothetical protein Avbf_17678 [Armadillidium vulgare]